MNIMDIGVYKNTKKGKKKVFNKVNIQSSENTIINILSIVIK